jgi:DNA replication ATP-dependent helicase Dna2
LYYCKTNEVIRIPASYDDLKHLIMNRNELALYLSSAERSLPPMLQNSFTCQRCFNLDFCAVYHKANENGTAQTSGLGAIYDAKTDHLSPEHIEFFNKWNYLISKEEGMLQRYRNELWTLSSKEREEKGRCLADMHIIEKLETSQGTSQIAACKYRMTREGGCLNSNTQLLPGDAIVASSESGHLALAIGFVESIDEESITIAVDRELLGGPEKVSGFHPVDKQDHAGLVEFTNVWSKDGQSIERLPGSRPNNLGSVRYRIDKDEMMGGLGVARFNLINLFTAGGDEKRRRLIVDRLEPTFEEQSPLDQVQEILTEANLNEDQTAAVDKVLRGSSSIHLNVHM